MNEVTASLDRAEGDTVVVTWRRPATLEAEGGEEFTTTLACSKYDVKNVTTSLEGTVGYVKVRQLTQTSADLVKQALADLGSQGALSFVLDIRDNPGGYLTQAVDMASLFVKSGSIVQIETKDGKSVKSATGNVATDKPLVVLVNENTAAAAEVLAAAPHTRCFRDPTRGGLASTLNELASQSGTDITVEEDAVPVKPAVLGACEMLGYDPLQVANEGKMVCVVAPDEADAALAAMRANRYGADAAIIGEVASAQPERGPKVFLRTAFGGTRILDMLVGEQLPRIC